MYQKGIVIAAVFLLLTAGVLAAPLITVDKNVSICNDTKCDNSTIIRQGLLNMPAETARGIRSIHVMDKTASFVRGNETVSYQATVDGRLRIYARGMDTSTYRATVQEAVRAYYDVQASYDALWEEAQAARKYPLPSWAPRPGQCDMGVRMMNSRGDVVCVQQRGTARS